MQVGYTCERWCRQRDVGVGPVGKLFGHREQWQTLRSRSGLVIWIRLSAHHIRVRVWLRVWYGCVGGGLRLGMRWCVYDVHHHWHELFIVDNAFARETHSRVSHRSPDGKRTVVVGVSSSYYLSC